MFCHLFSWLYVLVFHILNNVDEKLMKQKRPDRIVLLETYVNKANVHQ